MILSIVVFLWNGIRPEFVDCCHGSTGSPLALSGILRGGVMVLEGAGILARGTGFCT